MVIPERSGLAREVCVKPPGPTRGLPFDGEL
jgi:hypothetical protein